MARSRSRLVLAGLMIGSGVLHFVAPSAYERIVPRALGHARGLVQLSGAAEMAAGLLLALPRTRRLGAWAVTALLVAVFPANVQMALDGGYPSGSGLAASALVAWVRVPLQVPLVLWALRCARPDPGVGSRRQA